LKQAAEETRGSPSYTFDLIVLNEASDPIVGSHTGVGGAEFSIDKILDALEKPNREEAIELKHQLQMQQRGDWSSLVASLSDRVPIWSELPSEAQLALLEGERRLAERSAADHAPDAVSFAKAVEIALRKLAFDRFAETLRTDIELEKHIRIALQDKFKQAHSFVRFVERGQHIELGSMAHVLRLCRGKTGRRLLLLGRLRTFIEEDLGWSDVLADDSLAELEALSQRRNPAAHSATFGEAEARETRELALQQLGRLSASRP
jgi:hypothetical protein